MQISWPVICHESRPNMPQSFMETHQIPSSAMSDLYSFSRVLVLPRYPLPLSLARFTPSNMPGRLQNKARVDFLHTKIKETNLEPCSPLSLPVLDR